MNNSTLINDHHLIVDRLAKNNAVRTAIRNAPNVVNGVNSQTLELNKQIILDKIEISDLEHQLKNLKAKYLADKNTLKVLNTLAKFNAAAIKVTLIKSELTANPIN